MAVQANAQARGHCPFGGRESLRTYVDALDAGLEGQHYLVDGRGMDVLSGEDRSALLSLGRIGGPPRTVDGKGLLIESSADGRFKLIAELPAPRFNLSVVLPYFGLLFGAIAGVLLAHCRGHRLARATARGGRRTVRCG